MNVVQLPEPEKAKTIVEWLRWAADKVEESGDSEMHIGVIAYIDAAGAVCIVRGGYSHSGLKELGLLEIAKARALHHISVT